MLPAEFSGYLRYWLMSARGLRRGRAHDALDDIRGQLLHHVHGVVHVHILDDLAQLLVGDGVDYLLLLRRVQLGEHLGALALAQQAEDHRHALRLLLAQLGEEGGDVELVHVLQLVLQRLQLAPLEQAQQLLAPLLVVTLFQSRSPPSI